MWDAIGRGVDRSCGQNCRMELNETPDRTIAARVRDTSRRSADMILSAKTGTTHWSPRIGHRPKKNLEVANVVNESRIHSH
jgi:hypothetical protein